MTEANSANTTPAANHRGLLALVITLGALILLAFGALVGGLLLGTGSQNGAADAEAYLTSIPSAEGSRIVQTELDGNRLLLRLEGSGDAVVVLEATTGRIIGRIELDHAP